MNKKIFVLLLTMLLILTACTDQSQVTTTAQTTEVTTQAASTTASTTTLTETTTQVVETSETDAPSENPTVGAKLNYNQVINKDMYTGFSDKQLEMLNENGFVVVRETDEYPYLFMHHLYEFAEYNNGSVFVTTDAVLNMFHIYYGGSLKALETAYYYNDIVGLTNDLITKVATAYEQSNNELKPYYQRLYAYLILGGKLLHDEDFTFTDLSDYDSESQVIIKQKFDENSDNWLALQMAVPDEVIALVDADYGTIINVDKKVSLTNDGITNSQILNKRIDATQYIVRGHYTQSTLLSNYFKGMMWFSQSGFDIAIDKRENLVLAQLLAQLIDSDPAISKMWNDVYNLTAFYSGVSDDLNYKDIVKLTNAVYGAQFDTTILLDTSYDTALEEEINKLPVPQIKPVLKEDTQYADLDYKRQYRLMGQRFTYDSYVMTKLTKSPERLDITPFDVLAATGNQKAEAILYDTYKPQEKWPEYPEALARITSEYTAYKAMPIKDLYAGWFRAIDLALNELFSGQIPYFMTTDAYAAKRVNTALGSFAELKHDNVLYAKQMFAEAGGMGEDSMPLHYVEPNVTLYQTLRDMITTAQQNVSAYQDESITRPLDEIAEYLDLFIKVSQKELSGELVSQEEFRRITWFGALVDNLRFGYDTYLTELVGGDYQAESSSALISDIATILQLGYLEVGIGLPYQIYALVEINGHPVITEGIVYSSFAFYSDERLTDEAWRQAIGLSKGEYGQVQYKPEDNSFDILELMPYTQSFIAPDKNNIEFKYIEMKWPKE